MSAWVAGAMVVGTVVSANSASKANKTNQRAIDEQGRALDQQVEQADRVLDFEKLQYEEGKTRQVGIDEINNKVINQNLGLMEKAGERADETYNFYKEHGRPVVQKTLAESNNWDSQGNIDAARGRATADVAQGFENAEQQGARALSRMGVNPSSGRFMALQQSMQAQKAAAMAGAGTNAEDNRRTQGVQMRQQASNIAQGLPAQSLAQGSQSSNTGIAASGIAGAGQAQHMALGQQMSSGMTTAAGIYGNVANSLGNIANNAQAQSAQNAQGWGNLAGNVMARYMNSPSPGAGQYVPPSTYQNRGGAMDTGYYGGGMADGGKVEGPGTGTSDSVQAVNEDTGQRVQLSNGEYVVSADTVKALGTKFFDNLQAKHHKPVNVGRAA